MGVMSLQSDVKTCEKELRKADVTAGETSSLWATYELAAWDSPLRSYKQASVVVCGGHPGF